MKTGKIEISISTTSAPHPLSRERVLKRLKYCSEQLLEKLYTFEDRYTAGREEEVAMARVYLTASLMQLEKVGLEREETK
jgi:hypothetical protein